MRIVCIIYNIQINGGYIVKFLEIEKIIKDDGWYFVKQVGSHKHYKHSTKPGKVTIPFHTGELDKGTVKSILIQAGL